jgi:NADH dehydrogenase
MRRGGGEQVGIGRRRRRRWTDAGDSRRPCPPSVTGASGFVREPHGPGALDAGHRVVALVRTPSAGEAVLGRLTAERRAGVDLRDGDVTRPASLPRPGRGRWRAAPGPSRATSGVARTSPDQHRHAPSWAMQAAGVRRLVHMGAMGVVDDPDLHYASSKARAEALVAASGLDWTILKPGLQFGAGDEVLQPPGRPRPDVAGHRPGAGPW